MSDCIDIDYPEHKLINWVIALLTNVNKQKLIVKNVEFTVHKRKVRESRTEYYYLGKKST